QRKMAAGLAFDLVDPSRQPGDLEAHLVESPAEQAVLFEAPAAAEAVDQLGVDRFDAPRSAAPQKDVEVLERYRAGMRGHDPLQSFACGRNPAVEADPAQVGGQHQPPSASSTSSSRAGSPIASTCPSEPAWSGSPFQSHIVPPAPSTTGTRAAKSCSLSPLSQTTSTKPEASSA